MSNHVTITGNLGQDPELRFIPSGKAVCTVSVGDTPRRFNRDTNAWEDAGDTLWLRCTIWGAEAEAVAELLRRGDKVTVVGRLKSRSWDDKDGSKRTVIECDADSVAKVAKPAPAQRPATSGGVDDPWATQAQQGRAQTSPAQATGGWGRSVDPEPPFAFPANVIGW